VELGPDEPADPTARRESAARAAREPAPGARCPSAKDRAAEGGRGVSFSFAPEKVI